MTIQLKEKVDQIQHFYGPALADEQREAVLGNGYVKYEDLMTTDDLEFWQYLCKKDFKRL